jgi:hypothetical protein
MMMKNAQKLQGSGRKIMKNIKILGQKRYIVMVAWLEMEPFLNPAKIVL